MNLMLNYVITRYIDPLLLAPAYLRHLLVLMLACLLGFVLIDRIVIELWESSGQIDEQLQQIDSKLARYRRQRAQINNDYDKLLHAAALSASLEKQFSMVSSERVESWLIQASRNYRLRLSQVRINTQMSDDQGEFFRVTLKISGSNPDIESFLQDIIRSDFFLIWEEFILEILDSDRLILSIMLKQYTRLHDQ